MPVLARAAVALACVGLSCGLLAVLASRAEAQSALLDPLALRVTVARQNAHIEVAQQRIVYDGDHIRTDATGQALVTYRDGSTVLLDTDSELVIEYIRADDGDLIVRMRQTLGRAWYTISQSLSWRGRYEVRTAAMASVIRAGSGSLVIVGPDGETTVVAIDGSVETTADGISLTLPAGKKTTVTPGHPPSSPAPAPSSSPAPTETPSPSPRPSATAGATPFGAPGAPSSPSPSSTPPPTPAPTPRPTLVTPVASVAPSPSATASLVVPLPTATILPTPRPTSSPIATSTPAPLPTVAPAPTVAPLPTVSIAPPVPLPLSR
jgi:hypothetical protein